jgi:muconate cycloisomerase
LTTFGAVAQDDFVITSCDHEIGWCGVPAVVSSKIQSVETLIVALPTRREHKWTGLTESIGRYVLVKMTDDAGNVGWGEAPALKDWGGEFGRYFGESAAIVQLVIARYLAPAAAGVPVGNIGLLHQKMDAAIKGYPYAKAAMDCAAYDLAGRASGLPVYTLLGGAVRDSVPIAHSIGLMEIEAGEREAAQVASEGIKTIKIKVGVEPARDVEMVRRIRAAVGPKVSLCVDANEGYKTPGEAIKTIRKMEAFDLIYAEQPVHGIARVAEVARAIDTPVMADESAWNSHDVIEIIERRAAQIVSIYTTKPGGLYRAMEVAAVCRAAGIVCNVNGSAELGIGSLANVALAAAAPAVTLSSLFPVSTPAQAQHGQIGCIFYKDDIITAGLDLKDGAIRLPTGPGLGIDADLAKIEQYRVTD